MGGHLAAGTQVGRWHALCVVLRMVVYAIVPRRRSYWIEAVEDDGERRSVGCFPTEEAAVRRLHELQERQRIERATPCRAGNIEVERPAWPPYSARYGHNPR